MFLVINFVASLLWLSTLAITFFKSMVISESPSAGMKMWLRVYIAAVFPKIAVTHSLPNWLVWVARLSYFSLIVCFYSFYHAVTYIAE